MHGIKIPKCDFALKRLGVGGGLMHEGGVFAGHYSESNPSSWSEPEQVID